MRSIKGKELIYTICISYSVINIGASIVEAITQRDVSLCSNNVMMLLWTGIAVFVLSIHPLFEQVSPLTMILVQYAIAMGLVMLTVAIGSLFSPVSKGGYHDIFLSFTIPYIIGAVIYYVEVFRSVHRQNRLLDEIQMQRKEEKNRRA
ncbi:DUF6608 family protein [Anaerosporobacter faecicola]|uniref:DUF6608 family protein n=1 Tax=Anaerosporobacter faecicola TaxID=2718714 RepID=UPI0014387538|nr:DUF6608 family protein [Anaerosporobacter faecicola]